MMNYLKLLNPFLKLKQPTISNSQTTFLKCIPFVYTVNNSSLMHDVKKFATFPVNHKILDPYQYKKGSETILDQLEKNNLEKTKNCIKIKDVFVMVRRDIKNNRRITIKLTKEYLKQIPLKSHESITEALIMKNKKEILPAPLIDTTKYLNSIHDYCMQNKSPRVKSVSFSEYLPKKNSPEENIQYNNNNNIEKHTKQINSKNDKKHIFDLIIKHKNKINPKEENCTEDKIVFSESTNANLMTDNEITQYLLDTKNYLNYLQNNSIKTEKSNKVLSCTQYFKGFKNLPAISIKNEIQNLLTKPKTNAKQVDINQKERLNQLVVDSPSPGNNYPKLLLDSNNHPSKHKLIQMSVAAMVLNSSIFNRDSVRNTLENNQNRLHCGSLLHPQISISDLRANKVSGRYSKITCSNLSKKECCKDETCSNKIECQTTNATIDKPNTKTCCANSECVIKKCLSAVRTLNKDNELEKYLEKLSEKPNKTITNGNIQNILKNREERMMKADDTGLECSPTPKQSRNLFEKSVRPCNNQRETHKPGKYFAAKCKILKISIAELLSNLDYLNKQRITDAFSQSIKFADDLEKQEMKRNKVLASKIRMADLIANKVKVGNHTPYIEDRTKEETEERRKKTKQLNNKENNCEHLEKSILPEVLQNSSNSTCKTQIGSNVPVYSCTKKC